VSAAQAERDDIMNHETFSPYILNPGQLLLHILTAQV